MITIDDFKKLDIRIGHIVSAEKVLDADKLLKLSVNFGEEARQIISGISEFYPNPDDLIGKKCAFAYNLEPRTIRGLESQGMILAVSGKKDAEGNGEDFFSLLETGSNVPPGSSVK